MKLYRESIEVKVLITGGQGFIGNRFVNSLVESGNYSYDDIIVVDDLSNSCVKDPLPYVLYKIPIEGRSGLFDIFKKHKPDIVFHFAAKVVVSDSLYGIFENAYTNICGSANVFHCCYITDVSKVVFISSGAVYGDTNILPTPETVEPKPISIYGINKYTAEQYLDVYAQTGKLDTLIFRFANVYGPGQFTELGVIKNFILNALEKTPLIVYGDGSASRDFVHVDDIASAVNHAFDKRCVGTFNVGTGKAVTINNLIEIIQQIISFSLHYDISVQYLDKRPEDILHSVLCADKLCKSFDWQSKVELSDGISSLFDYYRDQMSRGH